MQIIVKTAKDNLKQLGDVPKVTIHLFWMKITWTKKSLLKRQEKSVNTHRLTQRRWQHYNIEYELKAGKNRNFM